LEGLNVAKKESLPAVGIHADGSIDSLGLDGVGGHSINTPLVPKLGQRK